MSARDFPPVITLSADPLLVMWCLALQRCVVEMTGVTVRMRKENFEKQLQSGPLEQNALAPASRHAKIVTFIA